MSILKRFTLEMIIIRSISSLCLVSSVFYIFSAGNYGQLSYLDFINPTLYTILVITVFIGLSIFNVLFKTNRIDYYAIFIFSMIYACMTLFYHYEFYYALGVIVLMVILIYYLMKDDKLNLERINISNKWKWILVILFFVLMSTYIGVLTILRYLTYNNSTYDFGIFAQMFYYMRKTGLPLVTCERDRLLSHFAVHISPIYYLILPIYFIFPSPITLQVMQALIVASGIIPLYLLGKHYKFSNKLLIAITFAYATYPALIGGTFYDIHENKFLTPLILWLFYFIEKKKIVLIYVFAVLVLFVKEDAPLYLALIALYLVVGKKSIKHGIPLFILSIGYFIFALKMLELYGEGAMVGRYDNFISNPEDGLLGIFKTIFLNPAYLIYQVFTLDKIRFMVLTLLPIAFLPFLNKKYAQFILLVPYLVMNLMSNYIYQHSIDFQYTYGVSGIFFYLVVINLHEMKATTKKIIVPTMLVASLLLFFMTMSTKLDYFTIYIDNYDQNQQIDEALSIIPDDASVLASGYFVPKLSSRDIIYNYPSTHKFETEYVVLDLRPGREPNNKLVKISYLRAGYTVEVEIGDVLVILKKE